MSNLTVSGGALTYERSVKVADYENKKLALTLTFGVPEGSEVLPDELDGLIDGAIDRVHEKLGLKPVVRKPTAFEEAGGQTNVSQAATAPAAAPKSRGKRPPIVETKVTPEEVAAALTERQAREARGNISENPEDRKDAANPADVDDTAAATVEGANKDPAGFDDELFTGAAPEITDSVLMDAITKKNAALKDPVKIRQLIGKYVTAPKPAREIPAAVRQAFLDDLDKL